MIRREDGQAIVGSLAALPLLLDDLGAERVLLVVDRGALAATGAEGALVGGLGRRLASVFDEFTPNPTSEQPLAAARRAIDLDADTLVAFGGGSCMDVAKVGALAAASPADAAAVARGMVVPVTGARRVVAIPTTSGTGSEATHFSAVYVDRRKVSVAHRSMRPAGVVLDPSLHAAMPAPIAAATGLDALCQATESWWASGATDDSLLHARAAQALALAHLAPSVRGGVLADRDAMMRAANLAGHAINISKTTAAHALSYELTTRFGIAHGLAVALTLGHVAAHNAGVGPGDCTHPGGPARARQRVRDACAAFGAEPEDMPGRVRAFLAELGMPATLAQAGVERSARAAAFDVMAHGADGVRLSNNPRRITAQDARRILEAAYEE